MRRKGVILTVVVAMMVLSCSQDHIVDLQQDSPIEFRAVMDRQTKAVSYSASTLQTFNVTAWVSGADRTAGAPHIDRVAYARTDDGTYKSAIKYYWPASGGLDFYAYAPAADANNGLVRNSELSYSVTPLADTDSQIDLVFAKNSGTKSGNGSSGVTLNFRHAMSQIRIKVKNNSQTTVFNVTGWKIAGVDGSATFAFDDAVDNTNTQAANSQNTIDASMWSGNADSYAASYSKTITSRSVTGTSTSWGELDGSAILIPQTAPQATAYSNQAMNGAYIAIQYKAINSDNNDVLVDTTWGCWPVQFEWTPGFRYNYVIDLSEFGYKEEGTGDLDPIMDNAEVKFVTVTVDPWQPEDGDDVDLPLAVAYPSYLRFRAPDGPQALGMVNMMGDATETNIEYSLDEGATWAALNIATSESDYVIFGNNNNTITDLLLRGSGSGFTNSATSIKCFQFLDPNQPVDCIGSVNTLIDPDNPACDLVSVGQFAYLFYNCTALRTAPKFPATVLTDMCYFSTFAQCTNLTNVPELPATTMTQQCYYTMFGACTSITATCALPATTLADNCYMGMFAGCTSLTRACTLPATTLAPGCYQSMFYNCSALTYSPPLPATVLPENCYNMMFCGTDLRECPVLYVDAAAELSCWRMFDGCSNMKTASVRLGPTLGENCFAQMFKDCSSITVAPELPATTLVKGCYMTMFSGCTSLSAAPDLPATTMVENCYCAMFEDCSSITEAPLLRGTTLAKSCYQSMFVGCTGLTVAPSLPLTELADNCYYNMFNGCTGITAVPTLPATVMKKWCYRSMFSYCSGITSVPDDLLPSTELAERCYESMFSHCTNLANAPALPATTLAESCYETMFAETALTATPYLPATTLAKGCYWSMFVRCSSLNTITAMFVDYNVTNHDIWHMFNGTASSGTFTRNSNATWTVNAMAQETDLNGSWSFIDVTP